MRTGRCLSLARTVLDRTHASRYAGAVMNIYRQAGILALSVFLQFEASASWSAPRLSIHSSWTDKSPHKSQLIQVNGIRLHYLDWGGRGVALVFLAGLGNNAHIFDDIAPRFTDHFHVLAMTRRGFGLSDKPESGYDVESRVADVLAFLEALQIQRVILVGHSIAGDELTAFAAAHPERVDKLVYLDAAFDRSQDPEAAEVRQGKEPPAGPTFTKEELASVDAYLDHFRKMFPDVWSDSFEANLRDGIIVHEDGTVERRTPDRVYRAIRKGSLLAQLDYTRVKPATLSFYANPATADDPAAHKHLAEWDDRDIALIRKSGPQIQIVQIAGAGHYLFIDHLDEVVKRMRNFADEVSPR